MIFGIIEVSRAPARLARFCVYRPIPRKGLDRKTHTMAAENNNATVIGRPFQPGQSGNPGGRPKGIAAIARQHTDKAIEVLVNGMSSDDERVQIAAAKEILDRGYGKAPVFTADLTGKLDDLDDDALDAAIFAIRDAIRAGNATSEGTGPQTTH